MIKLVNVNSNIFSDEVKVPQFSLLVEPQEEQMYRELYSNHVHFYLPLGNTFGTGDDIIVRQNYVQSAFNPSVSNFMIQMICTYLSILTKER